MNLPPKPAKRALETSSLTRPIEAALNRIPGVRVTRNNTGCLPDERGIPVRFGLGVGSSDLVGIITLDFPRFAPIGRVFCLEVKRPGKRPTPDQTRWLDEVRKLGGFACVVTSIKEAQDAVVRARRGERE